MNKNKKYSFWLLAIILISILISCSKQEVKPKYSDLQGSWKFNFIENDTISGTFQISKSDQEYLTSGHTIKVGDLYVSSGTIKLGKNVIISNTEKYLVSDSITVYTFTPDLNILTFNKITNHNNITITCDSEDLYYNNTNHHYNQSVIISRY